MTRVPTVTVIGKRIRIPDDLAMKIMMELREERETLRTLAWRKFVLCCTACATPCTQANACACCSTAALNLHTQMMTADEFLARAEARLLGGAA